MELLDDRHHNIMKMKKIKVFHIAITILLASLGASAQGLVFNDSIKSQFFNNYDKAEVSRAPLPSNFSLKAYTPYVHYQLGSECVAYSFATAQTILYAIAYDWRDQKYISNNSFSPHFIYYRNKDSDDDECMKGLDPFKVTQDVIEHGMAKLGDVECPDYYPCSMEQRLCNYYPPNYASDLSNAWRYKLDDVFLIENNQQLRNAIALSRPVVIGMQVPESFRTAGDLWTPKYGDSPDKGFGHAMIVVAYDDYKYGGAVQLMNSWGEEWGNQGFCWVKYDDLQKFVQFGLALDKKIGRYEAAAPDSIPQQNKYSELNEPSKDKLESDIKLGVKNERGPVKTDYTTLIQKDNRPKTE